jgi:predicted DsbA family dithiol-disulfide isomerase
MSELENVETEVGKAITDAVKATEGEAKSLVQAVEDEAKKVETEVKTEVAKLEPAVKAATVKIKAEESLVLREAELEYLKSQMEIQRLSKVAEAKSKEYTAYVEKLFKTYVLDKAEYAFDGAVNIFKKL